MVPLTMIVSHEIRDGSSKVALANRNDPIEALLFNRSHEAFCVRIRIRCSERCLYDSKAGLVSQPPHLPTPFPIPIADQHAVVS